MAILRYFLKIFKTKIVFILEVIELFIASIEQYIVKTKERKQITQIIAKQILFTGYDALKLIGMLALILGGIILFLANNLSKTLFFDKNFLGTLMSEILLRELAPLITAIILIGRSGTAIATEIGNMKVNNEIEAIESMGIDPIHLLIAPRIIGMTLSLIFLVIYFFVIGMLGGYFFSKFLFGMQMPIDEYFNIVFTQMSLADIGMALLKSTFFGIFISTIACHKGLKIGNSITLVPVVASQTVVSGITSVFFFYAYFTVLFYL